MGENKALTSRKARYNYKLIAVHVVQTNANYNNNANTCNFV